jgi:hypothetical protein
MEEFQVCDRTDSRKDARLSYLPIIWAITARDMYGSLSPNELRNTFESVVDGESHALHIRDLTEVPYIDSAGLGLIVSHYVRCRDR